jgi:dTDP-4-dehydrorhamnose 3,5-epimerase-like enzyme
MTSWEKMGMQDKPGPHHRPSILKDSKIDGVVVESSPFVEYLEDNVLTELYRPEWVGVFAEGEPIEHIYTVLAPTGGLRSEWYYHIHTLDRYVLLSGVLLLGLYDGRENSPTYDTFDSYTLGTAKSGLPNAIRIPPGVWHSLKWVEHPGLFLNAKLPGYLANNPDKYRVTKDQWPSAIVWDD